MQHQDMSVQMTLVPAVSKDLCCYYVKTKQQLQGPLFNPELGLLYVCEFQFFPSDRTGFLHFPRTSKKLANR